jgi:prolyl-tRNA synthetase
MRQSEFFETTLKNPPKDETSINAKLLIKSAFVEKVGAGIYSFLPLGFRVLRKIEKIIREEMIKIGGREILMPALHPKEYWQQTGRWKNFDALYRIKGKENREYALGPTHEEIVVPLAKKFLNSYKSLPFYLFQIQTKFRDEPRAKSGLLRGREFLMKDLYSFHKDEKDLENYYQKALKAYREIFKRCGLRAILAEASGGSFSKFSHEFQVATKGGEDIVFVSGCGFARNKEIFKEKPKNCPVCGKKLKAEKTTEVGNIFKLKTKYSDPFGLKFKDENGKEKPVVMGCYGIGISRLMAAIVEVNNDEKGIIWPEEVAPFAVHLLCLGSEKRIKNESDKIYKKLIEKGLEVLFDDRDDKSAGEKFADSDLMGIPWRAVVSGRTLKAGKLEIKKRNETKARLITINEFVKLAQISKFKASSKNLKTR